MTEHDSNADDGPAQAANDRIEQLEATVETLAERVVELESGRVGRTGAGRSLSRRAVLGALGVAGLAGAGATTASADPQGQVGTQSDPLRSLRVEAIDAGLASTTFELSVGGDRALLLGQEEQTQSLAGPVVLGHSYNSATGAAATISGGGRAGAPNDAGRNATVGGGNGNEATADAATVAGGFGNEASGRQTAIGGGIAHAATALQATIGGGNGNAASGEQATVGGGTDNAATAAGGTIGGGRANEAGGDHSTIGGGVSNRTPATNATVAGGESNEASGSHATVGGGNVNWAMGENATVPGGLNNRAVAPNTFAAGNGAVADHEGAFVWGDAAGGTLRSQEANEIRAQASGGISLFTDASASSGVRLNPGSGSWSSASSRTLKSDVEPVSGERVLDRVTDLEISRWSYDSQPDVRHMGPMAEAFHDAFGLGDDEERIGSVDADGVALAAIQGLAERHAETDDRVAATEERVEATGRRVADLEAENETLRAELSELRAELEFVENAILAADGSRPATGENAGDRGEPRDDRESERCWADVDETTG